VSRSTAEEKSLYRFMGRDNWNQATLIAGSFTGKSEEIAWPFRWAWKHDVR
jgi:hypothetical protein